MKYIAYILLLAALVSTSCNFNNDDEIVPAYIYIPEITVNTNNSQNSASSNITDAWVTIDGQLQGVYELPVHFPVLANGPTDITIQGGIKLNGISNTRAAYPFYEDYTITRTLKPTETDTIMPVVEYKNVAFTLLENFESTNAFNNMLRIENTPDVFEGNACGQINMDSLFDGRVRSTTIDSFYIDPIVALSGVFIEMDYKNNYAFTVNLRGYLANIFFISEPFSVGLNTQNDWNKVYLNLTPDVTRLQADYYEIFLQVTPADGANPDDIEIFIDNFKVVHL